MNFISKIRYDLPTESSCLLGVDLQLAWSGEGPRAVPGAAEAAGRFARAADHWRAAGGTVVHAVTSYNASRRPPTRMPDFFPGPLDWLDEGSPWVRAHEGVVADGDTVITKTGFDATATSDLLARLEQAGVEKVAVGGLVTPICVQATVDGLYRAGLAVVLLHDACASGPIGPMSPEDAHEAAVHRMAHAFADVRSVDEFVGATGGARQPA